jgi:hypothetical protein
MGASNRESLGGARRQLLRLTVALAVAWLPGLLPGQGAVTDKKDEAEEKVALPPEIETKLAELLKKTAEVKRKFWAEQMQAEIERVVSVASLDGSGSKALEAAATQAVDASLGGWSDKLGEGWRKFLRQNGEGQMTQLDAALSQVESTANSDWFGNYVRPQDQAQWPEALRRTLTAEQFVLWEKAEKARTEVVEKEVEGLLKTTMERTREQQRRSLLAKGAEIKFNLSLPKERAAKLDALADRLADRMAEEDRKRALKAILSFDDTRRRQFIQNGRFFMALDETAVEDQQKAWTEGVAAVLSDEEQQRLRVGQENQKARGTESMGRMLVAQLDEKAAFTASQRIQLQPLAERLVKEQKDLFPEMDAGSFYRIETQSFLAAGAKAPDEKLKLILDAAQREHWKESCSATNRTSSRFALAAKAAATPEPKQPIRVPEPEDFEHAISDHLQEKAAAERKRLLAVNLLRAEDAARVAGLGAESVSRLQTAARGAAEEALAVWKASAEQEVRSSVAGATAADVKQRLVRVVSYFFRSNRNLVPGPQPLWEKTVKAELTEPQRAAWKKEVDERKTYREQAIAAFVMATFARRNLLSAEQWTKLEPIIARTMKDYGPDLNSMFSSSDESAWYLQSYSMFIPFAAVPEPEIKGILSKEQWDRWTGSQEYSMTTNYWENIQRMHDQRVKAKKE